MPTISAAKRIKACRRVTGATRLLRAEQAAGLAHTRAQNRRAPSARASEPFVGGPVGTMVGGALGGIIGGVGGYMAGSKLGSGWEAGGKRTGTAG